MLAVSGAEAWETWWARPGGPSTGRAQLTEDQFLARLEVFADIEHVELADAEDELERLRVAVTDYLRP